MFAFFWCVCLLKISSISSTQPSPNDINSFTSSIDGYVYNSSDSTYLNITHSVDNQRNQFYPLLIVLPINNNDIIKTINFTKQYSLPFSVLGGGHNAVGWCLNDNGIVLSMQYYSNISIIEYKQNNYNNNNQNSNLLSSSSVPAITLQAGLVWSYVYSYINSSLEFDGKYRNYFPVGGTCSNVGVMGYLLGGGISLVSRSFGLLIDNVLEITVITPGGNDTSQAHNTPEIITLKNSNEYRYNNSNDDLKWLLWGLLGGGGNNFGIVTDVVVNLHASNAENGKLCFYHWEYFVIGFLDKNVGHGASLINNTNQLIELLTFYNEFQSKLADDVAIYGLFKYNTTTDNETYSHASSKLFKPSFNYNYNYPLKYSFEICCSNDETYCNNSIQSLLNESIKLFGNSENDNVQSMFSMTFEASTLTVYDINHGLSTSVLGGKSYIKSNYIPAEGMTQGLISIFIDSMLECPTVPCYAIILWDHIGGKIGSVESDATAYYWRENNDYLFEVKATYVNDADENDMIEWANELELNMMQYTLLDGNATYVNYMDEYLQDWGNKYYGKESYEKLQCVKSVWDSGNFFHVGQNVKLPDPQLLNKCGDILRA